MPFFLFGSEPPRYVTAEDDSTSQPQQASGGFRLFPSPAYVGAGQPQGAQGGFGFGLFPQAPAYVRPAAEPPVDPDPPEPDPTEPVPDEPDPTG